MNLKFDGKRKDEYNVSAKDVSKALLDVGIHPPTMYFTQIVPEALMIEPNETESKETLDFAIHALRDIYRTGQTCGRRTSGEKPDINLQEVITPKVDNAAFLILNSNNM